MAQPHSARGTYVVDWDIVGQVLATEPAPEVSVFAHGNRLPFGPPRCLKELTEYLGCGISFAIRGAQHCHASLAALAHDVRAALPGDVEVQILVTAARTNGLGWQYDEADQLIAQIDGSTEYEFRENTVETDGPFPPRTFAGFGLETSPIESAILEPGDFLYIPARWWHRATCREDSLVLRVAVMAPGSSAQVGTTLE